jgi:FMN phosphatase YigB (HAD superfamily)
LNLRPVRHVGDDPLGRLDRIVLVRLSLRKFIEDCLRQFALFEVEHAIVSEQEPAARLSVRPFVVELKNEGFILVLCSKGDRCVQQFRIRQSDLAHYFRKIYIVREKGEAEFGKCYASSECYHDLHVRWETAFDPTSIRRYASGCGRSG